MRATQAATPDWVPGALAVVFVTGLFVLLALIMRTQIPTENRDLLIAMVGTLGGAVMTILTFYFGSSRGSREKDAILGRVVGRRSPFQRSWRARQS